MHGAMRQMGNVAWMASDEAATRKRSCTPVDIEAVLAEPPRPRRGTSGSGGGWLEGLRVLDLTNVIAGPTIGSTLARFGAEVTLVRPVEPSVDPWNAVVFGLQVQCGKESILLDLSTDTGQAILGRLIAQADVVTMNGTDAQCARLGLMETTRSPSCASGASWPTGGPSGTCPSSLPAQRREGGLLRRSGCAGAVMRLAGCTLMRWSTSTSRVLATRPGRRNPRLTLDARASRLGNREPRTANREPRTADRCPPTLWPQAISGESTWNRRE